MRVVGKLLLHFDLSQKAEKLSWNSAYTVYTRGRSRCYRGPNDTTASALGSHFQTSGISHTGGIAGAWIG